MVELFVLTLELMHCIVQFSDDLMAQRQVVGQAGDIYRGQACHRESQEKGLCRSSMIIISLDVDGHRWFMKKRKGMKITYPHPMLIAVVRARTVDGVSR